jgi:site-specific recombinase XerD
MSDLLRAFRRHLEAHRSPRTVRTYTSIATTFLSSASPPPDRADVEAFLARPRKDGARRAAAGRNQELAALRALSTFAAREGTWKANPTEGIPFAREAPHDPVVLGVEELRQLFRAAATHPPAGERAQILAVLALLSQTGMRVHELVALNLDQVDLATGTLLSVRGKGDTVHDLPLNAPAVSLLSAWLEERGARAPPEEQTLFISGRCSRLSVRTIENWMVQLRAKMRTTKKITPHTLRHTAATLALTMGTDLATVAELLRHSDLNTTRRYLHLVDTRRRDAVRRLSITVPEEVLRNVTLTTTLPEPSTTDIHSMPKTPRETSAVAVLEDGGTTANRLELQINSVIEVPQLLDEQLAPYPLEPSPSPCPEVLDDQHGLSAAA